MNEGMKDLFPAEGEESRPLTLQRDGCGEVIVCEAAGEYTLPDYQPEIRKILHIRASVLPAGKYLGGRNAEFSGTVSHDVLYADAEGALASVTLPADYAFSVPYTEGGELIAIADSMADATVCRLSGPRKISLRTRVRSLVHLLREESMAPDVRGMAGREDSASLEKMTERAESARTSYASSEEISLSSTVRPEGLSPTSRAVWSGGGVLVNECRAQADGVLCRGEVWARALLSEGEGIPLAVREKLPFECFVPMPALGERAALTAYGRLLEASVSLSEGSEEEPPSLTFDVLCEVEVLATESVPCEPVLDLYSTAYDMHCTHRELSLARPLGAVMGNYTVSASRPRSECEAEGAVTVVDADGRTEIHSVSVENGRATVTGRIAAQVIFASLGEGERPTLLSAEVPIPFRIETELRPESENARFFCHGELIAARARIDDRAISVDAELALTLRAEEERRIRILSAAEPDRSIPVDHRGNRIFVTYPGEKDTLFSVAAHYHKSRAAIVAQNGLGEEALTKSGLSQSLDGVHHLLIED